MPNQPAPLFTTYPDPTRALQAVLALLALSLDDDVVSEIERLATSPSEQVRSFAATIIGGYGIDRWDAGIACNLSWA